MSSLCTTSDCFNHRALGIRPRSPIWLARVSGYLKHNHRRTALGSPKAKTPQDALWSWLLARATAKRLKAFKRPSNKPPKPLKPTCKPWLNKPSTPPRPRPLASVDGVRPKAAPNDCLLGSSARRLGPGIPSRGVSHDTPLFCGLCNWQTMGA